MPVAFSNPAAQGPSYFQQTVDPNSLVSNQLNGLLSGDSAYINQARAQGTAQAAGRGLLNGSMSAGSSENAAIAAAEPIAAANAQEYAQVDAANQQAATAIQGANIQKSAQLGVANIQRSAQEDIANMQAKQQFQEYGMGLGYQYAQLGQQGQQFAQQLQQNATQFTQSQNTAIAQFQAQQSFAQYQLGLQQQMTNQQNYATMFSNIMMNPNMTADQRSSALGSAQSFFQQQSQFNAALPAFVPPYVNNPDYWSQDFTAP